MPILRTLQLSLLAITCCLFTSTRLAAQKEIIDTKTTNPVQTLSSEELNKIPSPRKVADLLKIVPGTADSNFSSSVGQTTGMNFINLSSSISNIVFYLPNEIYAGQSFTGTMSVRSGPKAQIQNYPFVARWMDGRFRWSENGFAGEIIRQDTGEFRLNLTRIETNTSYLFGVPVQPGGAVPAPAAEFPTSGTAGNPLQIKYPTGGVLPENAFFKIGDMPAPILTATAGSVVVQNNYTTPGVTEIETNIGNTVQRYKFRNITLRLSADKTNLVKGETTPLRIEVAGLANLRAPAAMTIDATGVVNMTGGNAQKFSIPASEIGADGVYRIGRTLTGTSAGSFGVKVVVVVEKENL